ncbi:MAG: MFS transporter [Devosia sp. 67-54]|uniref:MDR family MFS transporter n=1 Tax=unclassified Devosia TaxID=196773 RepID=UPI0009624F80|nr:MULTISPECIES: MDR family MFS transporter [unclassified Devosia]MBN9306393.1 MFS transporter [Devosia sp.]OJX18449.1 MAG: MFS transporter [Devosia sp. 67-54]
MTIDAQLSRAEAGPDRTTLIVYLGALTAMFMGVLDMNIVVTALPTIAHDLGNVHLLGWVGAAYLLSTGAASPFYGKLGDMYGRKPVVIFAVTVFLLGSLLCGFAWSMEALIGARVIQGIGGGGLMVSAFAIIGELFEPRERARYQGYSSAVFTLGSVLGPVGGGYLTDLLGWRSIFLVNIPIGLAVLAIVALGMRRKANAVHHRIDILGGVLLAIATVAVVYWSDHVLEPTGQDVWTYLLPVIGAVAVVAFVLVERRAAEPIIPLRLFANRTISMVTIVSVLGGMSTLGLYFYFALFMQMITGLPPGELGLLFLPMSVTVAVVSIAAGRIVASTGRYKWLTVAGMAVGIGLMLFYANMDANTPLWVLCIASMAFGVSMGLTMQTLVVAIQAAAPLQDIGAATGLITQARTIGASLGLALNGAVMVLGLTHATVALAPDVAAAIPGGLAAITPKSLEGLAGPVRDAVLHGYATGFAPTYLFVGGLYLAATVLLALLPDAQIPKRAH